MKILNKVSASVLAVAFTFGLIGPVVALAAGPAAVNLGTAGNFVILSKTGISTTGTTKVVGDIGVSPAEATYITGFDLILPAAGAFSTSALVTGKVYAPSYAVPTPSNISTAVSNMETAYTDGAGRSLSAITELGAGNIGGMTLAPGLYKWSTGLTIPTDVTLSGSANDVWIFIVAQNLDISSAKSVVLAGGAKANNIFWIVAGQTTIGTGATFNGNILDQTAIVLNTGATLNGRALAQSAVTLDAATVTMPTSASGSAVTQTQTSTQTSSTNSTNSTGSTGSSQTSSGSSASDTNAALQAQLNGLLATYQSLQTQWAAQQGSANPNANALANANANASFNRNLTVGLTGNDVKALQTWLNAHGYAVALSGSGSSGNETTTFGELTRSALAKFQKSVGITPASGYFGTITKGYLKTNY